MPHLLAALALAGLVAAPAQAPVPRGEEAADERPNVVVLLSDDQAHDFLSCAGHPWIETPALDRLAREGCRFRNAFVTTSLCSPSRASFLTGLYAHRHGVRSNEDALAPELPSFASLLRRAGYETAYVGKWHMGEQSGPRPGFDYSASYVGQGTYRDAVFEVDGASVRSRGFVDDVATDYAIEFLTGPRERPFCLVLGFKAPHRPLDPPERLAGAFAEAVVEPPPNAAARPPFLDWVEGRRRGQQARIEPYTASMMRRYGRLVAAVDENVGRVLETLDRAALSGRTVVVFASDNGMMLGAHGFNSKVPAYEESIRIPLLVRYPPLVRAESVVDALALNVDLAPTLLELAGVPAPAALHGRSLLPLLRDGSVAWRDGFLYEFAPSGGGLMPAIVALRTTTWKLVTYPDRPEWTELFDLATDPFETRNLAADPAHAGTRSDLAARLEREKQALGLP